MKCGCTGYERLPELTICPEEDAPSEKEVRQGVARSQPNLNSSNDHRHAIYKFVSLHVVLFWVMTACSLVRSVFEIRRNIMFYVCRPFVFRKVGTQAT